MKQIYTNNEKLVYFMEKQERLRKQLERCELKIQLFKALCESGQGDETSHQDWKERVTAQIKEISKKKKKKGAA